LNLIGPDEQGVLESRHLGDSLRLLPLATSLPAGPAIDVGSGGGLPGVPLAIAQPGRPWRLLEPRRNRAAFLELVVRELDLNAEVVAQTAEASAALPRFAEGHVLAVARALAAPIKAFELLLPLVRPGGAAGVLVGVSAALPVAAEVPEAGLAIVRKHADGAGREGDHGSDES
jgi:16S rRNA (guanine527-N7)-methyltransferase